MRRAKLAPTSSDGRLLALAAKEELQATQQKFSVGQNPLEREAFLKVMEPTYTKQLERMCELMELYNNTNPDPSKAIAVEMWRAQIAQGAFSDHAKMEFVRRFYYWLLGRAAEKDAKRTFWGRANVAEYNDEVRAYLEMFIDKRAQFAQQMALLASRLPTTLVGYYLYFKYIVDGRLKRVNKDGVDYWDMGPEDFLDDFEMFESEFNKDNNKQTLGHFSDPKPPFHGGMGAYPANQVEGKREELLAFEDLHPEKKQVVVDKVAQQVVDGLWNLLHPVLEKRQPGRDPVENPASVPGQDVERGREDEQHRRDQLDEMETDDAGRAEIVEAMREMTEELRGHLQRLGDNNVMLMEQLINSEKQAQKSANEQQANFAKLESTLQGLPAAIAAAIAGAMPRVPEAAAPPPPMQPVRPVELAGPAAGRKAKELTFGKTLELTTGPEQMATPIFEEAPPPDFSWAESEVPKVEYVPPQEQPVVEDAQPPQEKIEEMPGTSNPPREEAKYRRNKWLRQHQKAIKDKLGEERANRLEANRKRLDEEEQQAAEAAKELWVALLDFTEISQQMENAEDPTEEQLAEARRKEEQAAIDALSRYNKVWDKRAAAMKLPNIKPGTKEWLDKGSDFIREKMREMLAAVKAREKEAVDELAQIWEAQRAAAVEAEHMNENEKREADEISELYKNLIEEERPKKRR